MIYYYRRWCIMISATTLSTGYVEFYSTQPLLLRLSTLRPAPGWFPSESEFTLTRLSPSSPLETVPPHWQRVRTMVRPVKEPAWATVGSIWLTGQTRVVFSKHQLPQLLSLLPQQPQPQPQPQQLQPLPPSLLQLLLRLLLHYNLSWFTLNGRLETYYGSRKF